MSAVTLQISKILFLYWDPVGASEWMDPPDGYATWPAYLYDENASLDRSTTVEDEYDYYAETIGYLLGASASVETITCYLCEIENKWMDQTPVRGKNRKVAEKIINEVRNNG